MSRPTHFLRHEHRVIEKALRALEGMCLKLRGGEDIPQDALTQLLDFIWSYADQHHHSREEETLFPVLEKKLLPSSNNSLGFIKHEHEVERRLVLRLGEEAEAFGNGVTEARQRLIETASAYRDHLIRHMQHEDSILFRLVEEMLDEETKDELCHALSQPHEELGMAGVEHYENLADELERVWAV
ncbi:MAG TPA: hemerythrin domain-containing protein [Blastocatellia bacterium]|nr:hemerythrin domain-containing protein [Blastocatellia bacterium]